MFIEFVKHNLLLFAVAVVSGGMLVWPLLRRSSGGPWVNTVEATTLINREDAVVIDVRELAEYAEGHILAARSLPLSQLERRAGELDKLKAKPVILCCASGNRSASALRVFKEHGVERVYNLEGGYGAWMQAGLPVEKK